MINNTSPLLNQSPSKWGEVKDFINNNDRITAIALRIFMMSVVVGSTLMVASLPFTGAIVIGSGAAFLALSFLVEKIKDYKDQQHILNMKGS